MKFEVLEERLACSKPNSLRSIPGHPRCNVWYDPNTAKIYGTSEFRPKSFPYSDMEMVVLDFDAAHSCPYARLSGPNPKLISMKSSGLPVPVDADSPMIGPPTCRRLKPGLKRVLKQIAEYRIRKGYDPAPKKGSERAELKF